MLIVEQSVCPGPLDFGPGFLTANASPIVKERKMPQKRHKPRYEGAYTNWCIECGAVKGGADNRRWYLQGKLQPYCEGPQEGQQGTTTLDRILRGEG